MSQSAEPIGWGVVLLAAGASTRMGSPKQLLAWKSETLLKQAARVALEWTQTGSVCVVLGANADACQAEIGDLPVQTLVNADWETGMAASLRAGVQALSNAAPGLAGVLVLLCDQPNVGAESLRRLWEAHTAANADGTNSILVTASTYNETHGVPALFERDAFPALLALSGAEGAKSVIGQFAKNGRAAFVALPEAAHDMDTPADYARLTVKVE